MAIAKHSPVSFFNSTTHLRIGAGYVESYSEGSDSYVVAEIVGGSSQHHVAPAANVMAISQAKADALMLERNRRAA